MKSTPLITDVNQAAEIIKNGGLVSVPTETVYGLAANGLDKNAVARIFEVKGRPEQKPLSLMVDGIDDIDKYCESVPEAARSLAARFWPGPLTIVLKSKSIIPSIVRAGGDTVGLRCPDHPLTRLLIDKCELPLAAPSANPSGAPSPKSAAEVFAYFDGKIDAVLNGGDCELGFESTVIDMSKTPYTILRRGALAEGDIKKALGEKLFVIGITGPSGAGKTTALRLLSDMGARVLDCDVLYHELLSSDIDLLSEIKERFPGAFEDGEFNRKKLGSVVFADGEALNDLVGITRKYVLAAVSSSLEDYAMEGGRFAAIDAIALIESGLVRSCAVSVCIMAPESERIERIMQREGISEEYAGLRVKAQKPEIFFRENCDYVIENTGDIDEFHNNFKKLLNNIRGGISNVGE